MGIDREALPGNAPEDHLGAERLAEPRRRKGADDVAATAHADDERFRGAAE
jgi:hypothetical protein